MKVHVLISLLVSSFLLLGLNQAFATSSIIINQPELIDCSNSLDVPQEECEALVSIYNSTGGENWTANDNWLTLDQSTSVCEWYGIWCRDGHVSRVYLPENNLIGTIPAEIGDLSNLVDLELQRNQLSGEIPEQIGSLSRLYILDLTSNQLEGQIPSSFGNLSFIGRLLLGRNNLDGNIPTEFGNLTLLTGLYLYHNQLSGIIPPELENLTNLEHLDIWGNNISGEIPGWIGNLSELNWVNLYGNELEGEIPSSFGNLNSINYLALGENNLSGNIPPELGNLSSLDSLLLNNNKLNGAIPAELGNLSTLDYLYLNDNLLTGSIPTSFQNFTSLELLQMHNNPLEGSLPQELTSLERLSKFWFFNTGICVPDNEEMEAWLVEQERRGQPSDSDIQTTGVYCDLPTGSISGQVTGSQGENLSNIEVRALRVIDGVEYIEAVSTTDDQGNYQIEGLGKGVDFVIQFIDGSEANPTKYYDNVAEIEFATPVTITLDSETSNINSVLGTPSTNYYYLNVGIEEPESNSGYVTSSPAGIDCSSQHFSNRNDCTESYLEDSVVTLTAIETSSNRFLDWSEPCSGQTECTVSMTEDITVTAIFTTPPPLYTIDVALVNGVSITSDPSGIYCGQFFINKCSMDFRGGTTLTLTAEILDGFYFHNWTGSCAGSANPCVMTVVSAEEISINVMQTPPTITPTPSPTSIPVATQTPNSSPTPESTPIATISPSATPNPPAETNSLIYLPAVVR